MPYRRSTLVISQRTTIEPGTLSLFASILKLRSKPQPIKYPFAIRYPVSLSGKGLSFRNRH